MSGIGPGDEFGTGDSDFFRVRREWREEFLGGASSSVSQTFIISWGSSNIKV